MIFTLNLLDDKGWEDAPGYAKGTKRKLLREENGCRTMLLKLPKHFHMDAHSHCCDEEHYVIDGTYTINNMIFTKGSYQRIPANEEHGNMESENGATLLVSWDRTKK